MSMDWREIRDRYLAGADLGSTATEEQWTHLNAGYRKLAGALELSELHLPNAEVTTTANQDYVDLDCDVYHLDWIIDKTTSKKLDPEPGGMRGRARFYEDGQSRPPLGTPHHYARSTNRIYLRDTPSDARDLIVSFRFHPTALTDSTDLSEHPITPPQYDMAIVHFALESYYGLHPPQHQEGVDYTRSDFHASLAGKVIRDPSQPEEQELLDRNDWMIVPGYDFNLWGR